MMVWDSQQRWGERRPRSTAHGVPRAAALHGRGETAATACCADLLNFADRSGRYSHYTAQDLGLKGIKHMKRMLFALLAVTALGASSGCCCLENWWCRPWGCCGGCGGGCGDSCGCDSGGCG